MPGLGVEIFECHVKAVHEDYRVIDVVSRGGSEFRQVSYLLPWISANGSGIDIVPKTGDQCVILATPSRGHNRFGAPRAGQSVGKLVLCIGFKLPVTPNSTGLELGGRLPGLPQGSVALRTLAEDGNEAMVLLTRGGTAIISANEGCRTLYSPVDSSIINIFNNWELNGPGGFVRWTRKEDSDVISYQSQYRVNADEMTGVRVDVRVGGEGSDPVDIAIGPPGSDAETPNERPYLRIRVSADGEAFIESESLHITGRAGVTIDGAEVKIKNRQVLGQGDPI